MSDSVWTLVRDELGAHSMSLGPYFAYQALHTPRHLLYTLARYKFAARMLPQQMSAAVLEVGCGEGFGTLLLAEGGHRVTAVDFDEEAIGHARRAVQKPNIEFVCADFPGQRLGTFDAVVSLDVIEHIPRERERSFVETIHANLGDAGFCVVGTPNKTASCHASELSRIGHVNLFTAERLTEALRAYFHNVFLFGMNDEVLHTGFYPMCHYLLALACSKKRDVGPSSE